MASHKAHRSELCNLKWSFPQSLPETNPKCANHPRILSFPQRLDESDRTLRRRSRISCSHRGSIQQFHGGVSPLGSVSEQTMRGRRFLQVVTIRQGIGRIHQCCTQSYGRSSSWVRFRKSETHRIVKLLSCTAIVRSAIIFDFPTKTYFDRPEFFRMSPDVRKHVMSLLPPAFMIAFFVLNLQ
jgi:hypothetical protein